MHAAHPAVAAGKGQAVAVMPFRDLSSGSRYVGEAIRETVTSDLKQLGSLRVVERGSMDKVLSEQNLAGQTQDPDTATVVRIGKIVGANLIVLGAYQKVSQQVRLTARFIKVETSEIVGSAKVDGSSREFLRLQDRVTSALLKSAGFPVHAKQILDESERRPELGSMKTLELYGQALTAATDDERRQYLTLAVAEDKNFSYAVKDLAELEQRMRKYQETSNVVQDREVRALREKLKTTTTRPEIEQTTLLMLSRLMVLRRYREVVREAKTYLDGLAAGAPMTNTSDALASVMISSLMILKDYDGMLREGERFLARAPGSAMFDAVKRQMEFAIGEKRRIESGRTKAEEEVAHMSPSARWDLCNVADLYMRNAQYAAALRLYRACATVGPKGKKEVFPLLARCAQQGGDWGGLRKILEEWRAEDSVAAQKYWDGNESAMPTDG